MSLVNITTEGTTWVEWWKRGHWEANGSRREAVKNVPNQILLISCAWE